MQTNISVDITNASVKYQFLEFDSLRNGMGLTQDAELGTALLRCRSGWWPRRQSLQRQTP